MNEFLKLNNKLPLASQLIKLAKRKYPVTIPYYGRLTEEEVTEIEKECDIRCPIVYMDGTGYYSILYREESDDK